MSPSESTVTPNIPAPRSLITRFRRSGKKCPAMNRTVFGSFRAIGVVLRLLDGNRLAPAVIKAEVVGVQECRILEKVFRQRSSRNGKITRRRIRSVDVLMP